MPTPGDPVQPLPKDAILVELRPEVLTLETRLCLLPGTRVAMSLVMERQALPLELPTGECLVVDKDRLGYVYRLRFFLEPLPEGDRHLIRLFIAKGRGAPHLVHQ